LKKVGVRAFPLFKPVSWQLMELGICKFKSWPSFAGMGPGQDGGYTGLKEGGDAGSLHKRTR
jgi:hypothetical protein